MYIHVHVCMEKKGFHCGILDVGGTVRIFARQEKGSTTGTNLIHYSPGGSGGPQGRIFTANLPRYCDPTHQRLNMDKAFNLGEIARPDVIASRSFPGSFLLNISEKKP